MPGFCKANALCCNICNLIWLDFAFWWVAYVIITPVCLFYHIKLSVIFNCVMHYFVFSPLPLSWPNLKPVQLLFHWAFFNVVNSFIISVNISSSLIPLMTCSFSLLSLSRIHTHLLELSGDILTSTYLFFPHALTVLE